MARSCRSSPLISFLPRWLILFSAGLAACGGAPESDSAAAGASSSRLLAAATVDNRYQIINLSLEGSSKGFVGPKGINASGQVAGTINLADGKKRAFMFDRSTMLDLGTLGGESAEAVAINAYGQVAGNGQLSNLRYHAFRYKEGVMHDLGTLDNERTWATIINVTGHVAGHYGQDYEKGYSFVHDGNTMHVLTGPNEEPIMKSLPVAINTQGFVVGNIWQGTLPFHIFYYNGDTIAQLSGNDYAGISAAAINNTGQFVGTLGTYSNSPYAAIWDDVNTAPLVIGLPGETKSEALDINDAGQVLGQSWNTAGNSRGFVRMASGDIADIGDLGGNETIPISFNQSGQAVGQSKNTNGEWRAFARTDTQGMVDLNTRLSNAPDGLVLENALAISDNGSIVALTSTGDLVLLTTAINHAPVVGPISGDMIVVNTQLAFSASFTDADATGTHTAQWNWGDGSPAEAGTVAGSASNGTISGTHAFSAAGIYTVSLTITDNEGLSAQVSRTVVVYDPAAGFVTGGGWFTSPAGAWLADPTLSGKANFSFVTRYKKDSNQPSGSTRFDFRMGNLDFRSESADWLVMEPARGRYAGSGSLNGKEGYHFLITAIDGKDTGGQDRIRMRIWTVDPASGQEVPAYDNQLDLAAIGGLAEGMPIEGGSIVIHQK